jgi:ATP-dependent Lon protease
LGIKTFILPAMNEPDLKELPEEIRKDMRFVPATTLEQVLAVALPKTTTSVSSIDAPSLPDAPAAAERL